MLRLYAADLLAAAARTTVCVEQEANRERQLAAESGAQALRRIGSAGSALPPVGGEGKFL